MNNGIELDDALRQFYGGDQVYRYPFGRSVYTEGIKFFCENAGGGAYWLLDILMTEPAILQEMRQRGIVFVRLTVTGSKAVLIVNADDGELRTQEEDYRDNMPESFEEKREAVDNACDAFESAEASIEEALGYMEVSAE